MRLGTRLKGSAADSAKSNPSTPKSESLIAGCSLLDDSKLASVREQLEKGLSVEQIDGEILEDLYSYLREYELERGCCEDYAAAKKSRALAADVKREVERRAVEAMDSMHKEFPIPDRKSFFETRWESLASQFDAETQRKREYMLKRHRQGLKRLDDRWTFAIPGTYRKPSSRLLSLKHLEKALAMGGDYDRAVDIQKEADNLAEVERDTAQQRLIQDYRRSRERLLSKQARELALLDSVRSDARQVVESRFQNELRLALNRDSVATRRIRESTRKVVATKTVSRRNIPIFLQAERQRMFPNAISLELKPPTDPSILENEERQRRTAVRQNQQFMRRKEEEKRARLELLAELMKEVEERPPTFVTVDETISVTPVSETRRQSGQLEDLSDYVSIIERDAPPSESADEVGQADVVCGESELDGENSREEVVVDQRERDMEMEEEDDGLIAMVNANEIEVSGQLSAVRFVEVEESVETHGNGFDEQMIADGSGAAPMVVHLGSE
jgi:hypothetical protein